MEGCVEGFESCPTSFNLGWAILVALICVVYSFISKLWKPSQTEHRSLTSLRAVPKNIYIADADGSNVQQLTDDPERDNNPAWSPDGTRIAFASDRDGNFS